MYACHFCHQPLSDDEQVVAAVTLHHINPLGSSRREYEGKGVFFHPNHWPGDSDRYRFRAMTTVPQAIRDAPPLGRQT